MPYILFNLCTVIPSFKSQDWYCIFYRFYVATFAVVKAIQKTKHFTIATSNKFWCDSHNPSAPDFYFYCLPQTIPSNTDNRYRYLHACYTNKKNPRVINSIFNNQKIQNSTLPLYKIQSSIRLFYAELCALCVYIYSKFVATNRTIKARNINP